MQKLEKDPAEQIETVQLAEPDGITLSEFFSPTEEKTLRQTVIQREQKYRNGFRQRAVVEVALGTGAKVNELVKLSCGDLKLAPNGASIRIPSEVLPRVLPLSEKQAAFFSDYLRKKEEEGESVGVKDPLICSKNCKRLTLRGWQSAFGLACKHAGLVDSDGKLIYNLETARRTIGRKIYSIQKNPHHVQAWLGLDLTSNADRYRTEELDFSVDILRSLFTGSNQPSDLGTFEKPTLELAMGYYNGTIGVMNRHLAKKLFLDISHEDPRREMFVARSLTRHRCMFPYDEARGFAKARKVIDGVKQYAAENDPFALYLLASAHDEGLAVERDFKKSNELYRKAADLGMETAMNNLGLQHFFGKGVSNDDKKAFELFLEAASLHEASAMFNLAFMYQNGIGTKRDVAKALRWLRKGATTGEARCMNNLSYCYFNGVGVKKDEVLAERWLFMSGILPPPGDGTLNPCKPVLIKLAG